MAFPQQTATVRSGEYVVTLTRWTDTHVTYRIMKGKALVRTPFSKEVRAAIERGQSLLNRQA